MLLHFCNFLSAATGIACLVALFNGLKEKTTNNLGNFWNYLVKSTTRILLPLSIIVAIILAFNGTPTSYDGKDSIVTLQGDSVQVSRGPAAGMIAIKQLGTNGGGWFGVNSAHPLENPNYLTNAVETISILLISDRTGICSWFLYQQEKISLDHFWCHDFFLCHFHAPSIFIMKQKVTLQLIKWELRRRSVAWKEKK